MSALPESLAVAQTYLVLWTSGLAACLDKPWRQAPVLPGDGSVGVYRSTRTFWLARRKRVDADLLCCTSIATADQGAVEPRFESLLEALDQMRVPQGQRPLRKRRPAGATARLSKREMACDLGGRTHRQTPAAHPAQFVGCVCPLLGDEARQQDGLSRDRAAVAQQVDLEMLECSLVRQALERTGGNQTKAAAMLGMARDQVRYRVEKWQLQSVGKDGALHHRGGRPPRTPAPPYVAPPVAIEDLHTRDGLQLVQRSDGGWRLVRGHLIDNLSEGDLEWKDV